MLGKRSQDSDELELCFDTKSDVVGAQDEGDRLFEDGKPSQVTQNVLGFCEQFEQAAQRPAQFMEELKSYDLLMDGEVSIQAPGHENPILSRGFQMGTEEKMRDSTRKSVWEGTNV